MPNIRTHCHIQIPICRSGYIHVCANKNNIVENWLVILRDVWDQWVHISFKSLAWAHRKLGSSLQSVTEYPDVSNEAIKGQILINSVKYYWYRHDKWWVGGYYYWLEVMVFSLHTDLICMVPESDKLSIIKEQVKIHLINMWSQKHIIQKK